MAGSTCSRCGGSDDVQFVRTSRNRVIRQPRFEEVPTPRGATCPACSEEGLSDEPCGECGGEKWVMEPPDANCEWCHGTGKVDRDDATGLQEVIEPPWAGMGAIEAWCVKCRDERQRELAEADR